MALLGTFPAYSRLVMGVRAEPDSFSIGTLAVKYHAANLLWAVSAMVCLVVAAMSISLPLILIGRVNTILAQLRRR